MSSDTSSLPSASPGQTLETSFPKTSAPLYLLFTAAVFLSAALLFLVQPMIARMLLPYFGGTPAVWNTCMVFFQAMLLGGYAYSHWLTTRLRPSRQILLHVALLLCGFLALPLAVPDQFITSAKLEAAPSLQLLCSLILMAGIPFFIVSTSGPLLQKWFSQTRHVSAGDPYFLYAASNLGSLLALLAYPALLEPNFRLGEQSLFWSFGFGILVVLIVVCALTQWREERPTRRVSDRDPQNTNTTQPSTNAQRWRWAALAFVPSSLMLAVTTYLTTDIASIPLLWVLPLALYLLTFVFAFAKRTIIPPSWIQRALPTGAVGLTYLLVTEATDPVWLLIALHLVVFFIASLACHGRLAQERPPAARLTEFYLWISIGGALGGIFNALVAPMIFSRVAEYPLALILACVLTIRQVSRTSSAVRSVLDFALPAGIGGLTIAAALLIKRWTLTPQLSLAAVFAIPLILTYAMVDRPLRFGLALGAVVLGSSFYMGAHGRTLRAQRNFFGVLRVTIDPNGAFRRLVHGNTVHGRQFIDPNRAAEPLSYYHRAGPLGEVFKEFNGHAGLTNVAVIGLGAGSMAAYATPSQHWTYYEINPAVVQIASDTNYFSFLARSSASSVRMVLGDARLKMRGAPAGSYHLIALDAFSSDSIPVHLITREALDLYLSKLAPGGWLAFHISNRCLELEPIVGDLAQSAGLFCVALDEMTVSEEELAEGKDQSHWVLLARDKQDFGRLTRNSRWLPVKGRSNPQVWSDDFSNILSVLKWN